MLNHLELGSYIADTVREPLMVLDASFRVMAANRAYYMVFDASPADTIERLLFDLDDQQWDIPELRRLLRDVLPGHSEIANFPVEHVFRGGARRSWSINACEIVRPLEHEYLILLAIDDVTERRKAEASLAARTLELERSNRELEQFAAIASHDLHEPLRKIRTYGDLILRSAGTQPAPDTYEHVGKMVHAATRMQALINEILALARLSSPYAVTEVNLDATLRDAMTDLETTIAECGATVCVGALPTVTGNAVQLRQLFQNLLANALKFRREGIAPSIEVAAIEAAVHAGPSPRMVEIHVSDNGIGFDNRYATKIFEPLERLHARSEYGGSGMGLALARRIVERHGGTISADGTPGQGAVFSVTLPAAAAPAHNATLPPTRVP